VAFRRLPMVKRIQTSLLGISLKFRIAK